MRWICAREALLLQGIPILSSLSSGKEVTGFASCKSSIKDTGRTATIGQAGNAMHSQCVAIALMYAVTQSNPSASMQVPSTLSSSSVPSTPGSHWSHNDQIKNTIESERERSRSREVQPMAQNEQHQTPRGPQGSSVSLARLMWMYSTSAKTKR